MGAVKKPPSVLFFVSLIFNDQSPTAEVENELGDFLGPVRDRSAIRPFFHSDYYEREMGKSLNRYFLLFESLASREQLPEVKLQTNEVEARHAQQGNRTVNIDPGYIALEHLVLATTKGYAHRIYLGNGIFGDLTLMFENGSYRSLPWTYPDYRSEEIIALCNGWRQRYKESLRCQKA
ncbi:MAG TPA: DUF4416 family protein [Syntrophorhabdales bacterium]|nr:DUF4416 family protein [Syntrophorhabdales bacterium]